jgi:signal transduction histidine kinase
VTLDDRGSALVVDGGLDAEFRKQAVAILHEAAEVIASEGAGAAEAPSANEVTPVDADEPELAVMGRLRAGQNLNPAESLAAAEVLFDESIESFAAWAHGLPRPVASARVARLMHHAIFRRFPSGAVAYTQALRERLSAAHQESRLRLSRDLHDRIAHGIAAGLQRVELGMLVTDSPDAEFEAATQTLRDTLADVQALALDLRQLVAGRRLDVAIEHYAADTVTMAPPVTVTSTGDPVPVPDVVAEEIFMVTLEAIRNARAHATGATAIVVDVAWSTDAVAVTITDDGPGFRHDDVATGSIGLLDMRERAESIAGNLTIVTAGNPGTLIRIAWASPRDER